MRPETPHRIAVATTGASGSVYARAVLEAAAAAGFRVDWVLTRRGAEVLKHEAGIDLDTGRPDPGSWLSTRARQALTGWGIDDFTSPFASGSSELKGMIVAPCSMGALARIASGASGDLVARAADVALKEGRKLVLMVRETPLSRIHLANMLAARDAGAVVLPAAPAFYFAPKSVEDLADFMAAKALQQFGVELPERFRWK